MRKAHGRKGKTVDPSLKNQYRWYDGLTLRTIPPILALVIKMWMVSCRVVTVRGLEKEKAALARSGGGAVYVTWHQRISYHFHYLCARNLTVMISQSRDGEYAARLATWLGFRNVRGSSTRGGSTALKEMVTLIQGGEAGGMLADGPLGPPRVAKIGSVIIARNAGVPMIPILWGADRCWVLNSWDRFLMPKPYARIVVSCGDPIWVPQETDGEGLESYRRALEDSLNREARWCDEQFGPERPWRKENRASAA